MGSTTTAIVLCLASVSLNPLQRAVVDRVDLVEINHCHDEQGRLVFDQIIFYDWSPASSRYEVRDWRLVKDRAQIPLRNSRDDDYVAIWHDFNDRDTLRKVHARMLRESWTQYDPELIEREFLPQERRTELQRRISASSAAGMELHAERYARRARFLNSLQR